MVFEERVVRVVFGVMFVVVLYRVVMLLDGQVMSVVLVYGGHTSCA